jgi:uncharacterized membrane protein YqjE
VKILVEAIVDWLRKTFLDPLIRVVRAHAAAVYLEAIRGTRRVIVLLTVLIFTITLIGAGLVLIPLALLIFMPWDPQTKATVGIIVGALYLLAPLAAMRPVFSEKRWMKFTHAEDTARRILD